MRRTAVALVRAVTAAGTIALVLAPAKPAAANMTTGTCDGSVTIRGVTYTPANDTPGNPVVVPNEAGVIVDYTGNTGGVVIKDHSGSISIHVGPIPIEVATWAGENADELVEKTDTYPLDQAYDALPFDVVGIYRVSGKHSGEGGACEGFAYVRIEGNPITTVPGAAATVVTVAAAGGVVGAAFAKKAKGSR